jgi:hypothetical protein
VDQAVVLPRLLGQGHRGLELGEGVVPVAGQEPLHGQPLLEAGERPADAVLLAAAPGGLQGRPGVWEPVELDEDVAAGPHQQRVAVGVALGVDAGQAHAVVDGLEGAGEVGADLPDQSERGDGDAGGQRLAGGDGRVPGLGGGGRGAVEVTQGHLGDAGPATRDCPLLVADVGASLTRRSSRSPSAT